MLQFRLTDSKLRSSQPQLPETKYDKRNCLYCQKRKTCWSMTKYGKKFGCFFFFVIFFAFAFPGNCSVASWFGCRSHNSRNRFEERLCFRWRFKKLLLRNHLLTQIRRKIFEKLPKWKFLPFYFYFFFLLSENKKVQKCISRFASSNPTAFDWQRANIPILSAEQDVRKKILKKILFVFFFFFPNTSSL